jgi:hypothetical protein
MSRVPTVCSHCRRPFTGTDGRRPMAILERDQALCAACAWFIDHLETWRATKDQETRPAA